MKEKKIPTRRCVGCMESKEKKELIRIAGTPDSGVHPDPTGKAPGRGIYLCPNPECFEKARKKKAIGRGLKMNLSEEQIDKLFQELLSYEK